MDNIPHKFIDCIIMICIASPIDIILVPQIPQYIIQISHNAPFCNRNMHISVTKWCIMGYMCDALWDGSPWLLMLWCCLSMSSATMVLITQDKGVLAFHQEGLLLPVPSQQGVMEEIQIHVCLYSP